ncbi:MAG: pyruvate formate lyase-activating protein [Clostridia bacterium]|nr:pyruvate formate lyase-activating protein [Clostridia bacterium]
MQGRIHSFESMGCADGPGVRFIVFFQGCPLRCDYCHNPDTQNCEGGTLYTAEEIVERALRYKTYFGKDGGITLSGGEPLLQAQFTLELLKACKEAGLHTVLDTSCTAGEAYWEEILRYTDLILADVKFTTEQAYRKHSGGSLETVLRFLRTAEAAQVPLWIRHVVVPGLTDEDLPAVLSIADRFSNVRRVELLPFKKMCTVKYDDLGIPFPLAKTPECDGVLLDKLNDTLRRYKNGCYSFNQGDL